MNGWDLSTAYSVIDFVIVQNLDILFWYTINDVNFILFSPKSILLFSKSHLHVMKKTVYRVLKGLGKLKKEFVTDKNKNLRQNNYFLCYY